MSRCQAVTGGTERRHQRRSDGHTWNNIALAVGAKGNEAGRTATGGYKHVVDGGGRARQQLRAGLTKGGEQEVDRGSEHTDKGGHTEIAGCTLEQVEIANAYGQPHADNRSHEGRDQHGADDYGC